MIETRLLKYFLAIVREQSITRAAESLFLSQPTLSRQMKELEEELGVQLFVRGKRQTLLTEEGVYLRARAQEMMSILEKTETTLKNSGSVIAGDIYAGFGESPSVALLMEVYGELQREHPDIHLHIYSGNAENIFERMDKGILDIGLLLGVERQDKYDYIDLPDADAFGVLMPKDHPLAEKPAVTFDDLKNVPLALPQQAVDGQHPSLPAIWKENDAKNIICTYNLLYNVTFLAEQGTCLVFCLDRLINLQGERNLTFRPMEPPVRVPAVLVTKKYQTFSPAVRLFLERIRARVGADA